jgi:hypothetical protein
MNSLDPYSAAWHKYRTLRMIALVFLLGFFPFLALVTLSFQRMHWSEYVGLMCDAVYLGGMGIAGSLYAFWRCPRCGKSYRGLRPYTGNQCFYCKLPKWAGSSGTQ